MHFSAWNQRPRESTQTRTENQSHDSIQNLRFLISSTLFEHGGPRGTTRDPPVPRISRDATERDTTASGIRCRYRPTVSARACATAASALAGSRRESPASRPREAGCRRSRNWARENTAEGAEPRPVRHVVAWRGGGGGVPLEKEEVVHREPGGAHLRRAAQKMDNVTCASEKLST